MAESQPGRRHREREVKLGATSSFRMPSLADLAEGPTASAEETERLSTTYLDTDDLRLARWGVSLRYREREGWTVKLPSEGDGPLLVRPELVFPGNGGRPPAAAVDLVRAFVRSEELHPQTRLETVRRRTELRHADGRLLADVVDDDVSVLEGSRVAARFRQLEVEVRDEPPAGLLDELLERLRGAGAGAPDPTPKYIRALGARAGRPPEVAIPELGAGASAGDVVRGALASSVVRLIVHDPVVRLDTDPEGVHQARVATRRLRSDLRTFATLLDPAWSDALREELSLLGAILGAVRDKDVQLARLEKRAAALPEPSARGAARVVATVESEREEAYADLLGALRGRRYLAFLDRLVEAANAPALLLEADLPAASVLPGIVRRPWRAVAKRVRALGESPTDAQLHEVRIRTKRVRYAAEAVTPLVGKQAHAFARAAAALQDVLGDLNDAVVAERWLRDWARTSRSIPSVFAAGELAGLEHATAAECRRRWREDWKALASPRLRSWM